MTYFCILYLKFYAKYLTEILPILIIFKSFFSHIHYFIIIFININLKLSEYYPIRLYVLQIFSQNHDITCSFIEVFDLLTFSRPDMAIIRP